MQWLTGYTRAGENGLMLSIWARKEDEHYVFPVNILVLMNFRNLILKEAK